MKPSFNKLHTVLPIELPQKIADYWFHLLRITLVHFRVFTSKGPENDRSPITRPFATWASPQVVPRYVRSIAQRQELHHYHVLRLTQSRRHH